MTDIANETATWLQRMGFGTVGTSIFVGQIPDNTNGLWVEHSGGTINKYLPLEESVVDIYVKDTSASDAITLLENVKQAIHRMHDSTINNAYVYTYLVLGNVETVSRDLEYAKIFKITVQAIHRDTAVIS